MKTKNSEKRSSVCHLGQKLRKFDQFGQHYDIQIEEGKATMTSAVGGICTLLLVLLLLAYAGYKGSVLLGKTNFNLVQAVSRDYFDETDVMGAEQDLKVAVAIYSPFYNPETAQLLDPTYGRIRFTY